MPRSERVSKVGPYIITETLGVGSVAKVKLCVHHYTLNRYAVKIIEKSLIRERMSEIQVRREIAIMSRLRHPNCVSLVSVHSTATKVFIVMELVTGGELFDEIFRLKRLSEPYARFYFRQLVQGIQYCHSHGIYHRDLKPENLLVDLSYTLKITDFGLATLKVGAAKDNADFMTSTLTLYTQCGTPNYVAPEIINLNTNGYSGAKVDAWACGIILYILVAGSLPFDSDVLAELFKAIVRCELTYPPFFSESLKDLINNLLKVDPSERYTLADVQQHRWYNESDERPQQPFCLPMRVGVIKSAATKEVSPVYPFPSENGQGKFSGPTQASDLPTETAEHARDPDNKDSLDLGMRVESVATGLTVSAIPRSLKYQRDRLVDTSAEANFQPTYNPGSHRGDTNVTDNLGNNNISSTKNITFEASKYGPDEAWVLNDTDRLVWCRMMKDFDMVPDIFEFGRNSATLSLMWQQALAEEKLRRKSSFASDRFGMPKQAKSRSTQQLSSGAVRSEAEMSHDRRKTPKAQDDSVVLLDKFRSALTESAATVEIANPENCQYTDAGEDMNHQGAVSSTAILPVQIDGSHDEEQVRDVEEELQISSPLSNPLFSPLYEEQIPIDSPSFNTEVELQPPSSEKMGHGEDLLEESKSGRSAVGSTTPPSNNSFLVLPPMLPTSKSSGVSHGPGHIPNHGIKVTAPTTDKESLGENPTPVILGQENDGPVLSPFAFDVPGPRRALPVTKTFLGSIVPSTVSPKRLLRKGGTPLDIKSFTQFHSLLDPSTCFDVMQSVLRDYGCTVIKTSSARSREKFRIRCESKKEDGTVHTRLHIYKVDDVLCTVHFKRLLHTSTKDFSRFYSDISRLYSETLKARGLAEGKEQMFGG